MEYVGSVEPGRERKHLLSVLSPSVPLLLCVESERGPLIVFSS